MSFEYMNEFIQNLPCVNNMCSSERNKLRRVLHFFSNYTAIDDNDVFTWKIQYFIQWYNRLQAASESLKTVDHNYLETPICFHQSTPIIYSQYPVWVQFVYKLCLPLDGILQIPNLSSLGILGTEQYYFPKQ